MLHHHQRSVTAEEMTPQTRTRMWIWRSRIGEAGVWHNWQRAWCGMRSLAKTYGSQSGDKISMRKVCAIEAIAWLG